MNGENINIDANPLRILISPLDWGLGHATRIITIVKILQNYGVQVLIAGEGAGISLLKTEFPAIEFLDLRGYRVQYSRKKKNFIFKLLGQLPVILASIKRENAWLKAIVVEKKIDAVISDNRFGFYNDSIPSVYITHQLYIETGNKWTAKIAQQIHYKYINRFKECWVPDFEMHTSLAGKLSHPGKLPAVPVKYLGPLSRFKKQEPLPVSSDLLILLSGPEPQRSIWETILFQQVKGLPKKVILVRGLPADAQQMPSTENCTVYNHLASGELSRLVAGAALLLCRSGYSSVMDLVALKKKAILVPTPGQTEQEYLAAYLKEQGIFYSCNQSGLLLSDAMNAAMEFSQLNSFADFEPINESIIKNWVLSLRALK
jgi:uncharacterized protein (TIGR00661 family)